MSQQNPVIALTFDDGPNTTTTLEVLQKLKKHNVVGTFFLIGKNITEETIPVIKQQVAQGCEVENHSMSHSFMDKLDAATIREEVKMASEKIKSITGREPEFFRPPFIAVNDLMYQEIKMPFICGLGVQDWVPDTSVEHRANGVLDNAQDGSIVLLHDLLGNNNTVEALDIIIPELKKRGYTFVTVSQLFKEKNAPVKAYPGELFSLVEQEKN